MSASADAPIATRIGDGPLIEPSSHPSLGNNVQGPSLIRVPDWIEDPLGRYYLYFAHHKGSYIRLAYADELEGPWSVHVPGSLRLEDSHFLVEAPEASDEFVEQISALYLKKLGAPLANSVRDDITAPHIASPDVHVDNDARRIVMYFHGLESLAVQATRVATSTDGIDFVARPELAEGTYLRAFRHRGLDHAITMPGQVWRIGSTLAEMQRGPLLFDKSLRHFAVLVRGDLLHVLFTKVGDAPERLLHTVVDLGGEWMDWTTSTEAEILRPEHSWEGADLPVESSLRSMALGPVHQLRDPAIFEDEGLVYLLYAIAGESGIALAQLEGI